MSGKYEFDLSKIQKKLPLPIKKIITFKEIVIVLIDDGKARKQGDTSLNRNVYALNRSGNIVWQIENAHSGTSPKPFVNIFEENGTVVVTNWIGVNYELNIDNDSITLYKLGERPW